MTDTTSSTPPAGEGDGSRRGQQAAPRLRPRGMLLPSSSRWPVAWASRAPARCARASSSTRSRPPSRVASPVSQSGARREPVRCPGGRRRGPANGATAPRSAAGAAPARQQDRQQDRPADRPAGARAQPAGRDADRSRRRAQADRARRRPHQADRAQADRSRATTGARRRPHPGPTTAQAAADRSQGDDRNKGGDRDRATATRATAPDRP